MIFSTGGTANASPAGTVLGAMLICESCANAVFTDDLWRNARPLSIETAPGDDVYSESSPAKQALRKTVDYSIALRAKRRGLSAAQARAEARELGLLRWEDEDKAIQRLLSQAPSSHLSYLAAQILGGIIDVEEPRTSRWAKASLTVSFIFPLLGIIFGLVALIRINRHPATLKGRGLAISGIVIGFLVPLLVIVVTLLVFHSSGR
jgi:hypothetical protein